MHRFAPGHPQTRRAVLALLVPLGLLTPAKHAIWGLSAPVVVGLAVFLSLSRSGPLGSWGLLFTPQAMVIAQTILVAPIIAALTRQARRLVKMV